MMKSFKTLAVVSAAVISFAAFSADANAQTRTVTATINTDSAITTAVGVPMNFGTWLVIVRNSETPTVAMAPVSGAYTVAGNTQSTVQNLGAATGQSGTVTVTLPAGSANTLLQMQHAAVVNPTDTNVTLSAITYTDTVTTAGAFTAAATDVPVTIVAGGTAETISFGGTFRFAATPTNAVHTATFDVSFAY
jgi:hypothetical protein